MRYFKLLTCAVLFVSTVHVGAEPSLDASGERTYGPVLEGGRPRGLPLDAIGQEKHNAGWTLAIDNDLLSFSDRDFDYTGGLAVTFAGRRARDWKLSLDPIVGWLDPLVPTAVLHGQPDVPLHSMQAGLIAFTPDDLNSHEALPLDRPYASLLFVANSRTFITHPSQPVYETSFTLGALGLDAAKAIQRGIHTGLDQNRVPEGWDHQISDGGEPTLRFIWARQALLASNFQTHATEYELKWRTEMSVGYLTEASLALSGRWGAINTPWWSFSPERADYVAQPSPVIGNAVRQGISELYVWGGMKVRARGYNAFLQGQFRDSEVEVDADRLERLIGEAWLGLTWQFAQDTRLSYVVRYQTREIKDGPASRGLLWSGFLFSRDL
jgi:hypothetical protein